MNPFWAHFFDIGVKPPNIPTQKTMFKPRLIPTRIPNTVIFWVLLDPILYNFGFLSITRTHFWSICLWEDFVWFSWKNWTLSQLFWTFAKGATGYVTFASLMKWIRTFLSTCLWSHPCAPQLNAVIYLTLDLKPIPTPIGCPPCKPRSQLCVTAKEHIILPAKKAHDLQQKHRLSKWYLSICWTRRWFKLALKKTSRFKDHPNEIHVPGCITLRVFKKHVFELG